MNTVIIPDLHLDRNFNVTFGDPKIWETKALQLVKHIISESNPDKLLFLGDVFNTSHPSFHSIFEFLEVVKDYDVTVISGNHDIPKTQKKSVMDYLSKYVNIISKNEVTEVWDDNYAIGWCDTQTMFSAKINATLDHMKGKYLFLHAAYNNWDNEMDNVITNDMIKLAKKKGIIMISGHEHISNIRDNMYHLGSIMPMNIGELGVKYYFSTIDGLVTIDHKVGSELDNDVILVREPIDPQGDKPIVIKKGKIKQSDIIMEEKQLTIDIIDDFVKEAVEAGFDENFVKEYTE